jgi:hypothetical protein
MSAPRHKGAIGTALCPRLDRRPRRLAAAPTARVQSQLRYRPDIPTDASAASPPFRPAGPKLPLIYGLDAAVAFAASARVSRCAAVSSRRADRRSPLLRLSAQVTAEMRMFEHHRCRPSTPASSAASPFSALVRPLPCPLSLRRSPRRRASSATAPLRARRSRSPRRARRWATRPGRPKPS